MEQEGILRLSIFFGLFFVFAAIENIFPRRMVTKSKARRWITNWSVSFLNVLTLRLFSFALPLLAIGAAFDSQNLSIGLFNRLDFPFWVELILVILLLDCFIWLQYLLTHKIGFLWLIHKDRGLFVSFRGALAINEAKTDDYSFESPFAKCPAPCLSACPVNAFTEAGYDIIQCKDHINSLDSSNCKSLDCNTRRTCPV
jgi:hypothetical protein